MIFYNSHPILCCGCYGSDSCTPAGTLCYSLSTPTADCVCDCCAVCNTCKQILQSSCVSSRYSNLYSLSNNQSKIIAKQNEPLPVYYIIDQTTGQRLRYLWDPCLRRSLPDGIRLANDTNGSYKLIGRPRKKMNETLFDIVFKGAAGLIVSLNFTMSVN